MKFTFTYTNIFLILLAVFYVFIILYNILGNTFEGMDNNEDTNDQAEKTPMEDDNENKTQEDKTQEDDLDNAIIDNTPMANTKSKTTKPKTTKPKLTKPE